MILSEILLASAIISLALGSVIVVVGSLETMLSNVQNGFEAALLAKKEIALAHLGAFDEVVSYQKTDGIFTTIFSATPRNDFTTNISADVSWSQGMLKKHQTIHDQIVDWRRAAGSPDCDWLDGAKGNLGAVNFGSLNIDGGNPVTDIAALGDYVYVSADGTTSSLPDLYVLDVHNLQSPKVVGRLNTGPGIASVAAVGQYIFAANAGTYQMQIIDVADPTRPILVAQAKLPGSVISGSAGFGQSVHFSDNKMYIGLVKNSGPELFVVDVNNPPSPITLGSYEIGSTVNDIDVQGTRAAIVTPGQTSLFLLDISNPAAISEISRTSFTGWQTQGAQSVEMLGSKITVGRTLGGFYSPYSELMILDRSNIFSASSSLKIGASIEKIFAFNEYLYAVTSNPDQAFLILHNDLDASTSSLSVTMSAALSSRAVSLACNRKAMYVVTQNAQDFFHVYSLP
jgi:hypothetical protein